LRSHSHHLFYSETRKAPVIHAGDRRVFLSGRDGLSQGTLLYVDRLC